MHRAVLQNKKYIKFADKNTVEVICMGGAQRAVDSGHKKAGTYTAKNANGEQVTYLVEFPGMTAEQLDKLASSGASKYRDRGIPFTAIVNPHTLEQMDSMLGSRSAGQLMDAVTAQKKILNKQYGKSLKRKTLQKMRGQMDAVRGDAGEGNYAKAMMGVKKLEKGVAKSPAAMREMVATFQKEILEKVGKHLDELAALIARGEKKAAAKELGPLARQLKGTDLESKAQDLLAKAKAE